MAVAAAASSQARALMRSSSFKVTQLSNMNNEESRPSSRQHRPMDFLGHEDEGVSLDCIDIQELLIHCFKQVQQEMATSHEMIVEAVGEQLSGHCAHHAMDAVSAHRSEEADASCEVAPTSDAEPDKDDQPAPHVVPHETGSSFDTMDCSTSKDDNKGAPKNRSDVHRDEDTEPALVGIVPASDGAPRASTRGGSGMGSWRPSTLGLPTRRLSRWSFCSPNGVSSAPEQPSAQFEVLALWRRKKQSVAPHLGPWMQQQPQLPQQRTNPRDIEEEDDPIDRCVVHPYHPARSAWDLASLFFVLYDMIMIPLSLFDPPETGFLVLMTWCTRMFWTVDVPLTFFSGYVSTSGQIELRRTVIAKRYLKTWFATDFLIVALDWLELLISAILSSVAGVTRLGKVTRIFRIIRMVRLLRIARMGEIINVLLEQFSSARLRVFTHILKLCTMMLAGGHFLACMWYGCGTINEEMNWLQEYDYENAPLSERYIMSYRWAIAQFGGGMDEVHPRSLEEGIYALVAYISAFWSGAVFISMLTSSMTQLCIDGSEQNTQLNVLRQYLEQNRISKNLALRLNRNANHALMERRKIIPEDSVEVVALISEPLRVELRFEIYSPPFNVHPFFTSYISECPNVMKKVCHSAMSMCLASAGDTVFCAGESPANPMLYFVNKGVMQYSPAGAASTSTLVSQGTWLCEASLWTTWTHRGNLSALQDCRLYKLDVREFQAITMQFEHGDFDPVKYAEKFVEALNVADPEDVSDLFAPEEAMALGVVEARSSTDPAAYLESSGSFTHRVGLAASSILS